MICILHAHQQGREASMLQHKVHDEIIEFMGTNVLAILNGLNEKSITEQEGFASIGMEFSVINENYWYPFNTLLNAFRLMMEKKAGNTLFSIGRHVIEYSHFPEMNTIEEGLASIDKAYHMNCSYMNGDSFYDPDHDEMKEGIGHYRYVKVPDANEAFMLCDDPFPCEFDRGLITRVAQAFDRSAKVIHDDEFGCRSKGSKSCRYIVIW